MTAVSLFDVLARDGPPAADRLAQKLVESALAEWDRLRQCEQEFTPAEWDAAGRTMEITRSIYALFEDWAAEAEQVLIRTRPRSASGHTVPGAEALEDAYGAARARLELTPERVARAMGQVGRGQFKPATELRDELRTRLRA